MNKLITTDRLSVREKGLDAYMEHWRSVVEVLEDNGMYWFSYIDSEYEDIDVEHISEDDDRWKQYVTLSVLQIEKDLYRDINKGTLMLNEMLNESVDKFKRLTAFDKDKILKELGFSLYERDLINKSLIKDKYSYITRFDFILNKDNNLKCVDFNSDMPKGIVESGLCTEVVCDYNGVRNYNRLGLSLENMFKNLSYKLDEEDVVYFSCLKEDLESELTLNFIVSHALGVKCRFVYLEDLKVTDEGMYDTEGNKVTYWFKYYPYEYWEKDGKELSDILKNLVNSGKLVVINPPTSHLVENKNYYRFLWSHLENNFLGLSRKSLDTIKEYLIPTYDEESLEITKEYVIKPVYGVGSDGVKLMGVRDIVGRGYKNNFVYQEYVKGNKVNIQTWDGDYEGVLILNSFVVNDDFCGFHGVVGDVMTDNNSYFVAYTVRE